MSRNAQQILDEARQLPMGELDWLVENLLIKAEGEAEPQIVGAWDDEIKQRLNDIDSGKVEMIPGDRVRAEMLERLSPQACARLKK